ncbi:hypothetical protein PENSPDRAFT_662510 [Peniophora sp. CONT]|nr:hypothetical protein PENSPDRAFT_662510 [Peniophora sp. CONT]
MKARLKKNTQLQLRPREPSPDVATVSVEPPPPIPVGMERQRALYGWRIENVAAFVKQFKSAPVHLQNEPNSPIYDVSDFQSDDGWNSDDDNGRSDGPDSKTEDTKQSRGANQSTSADDQKGNLSSEDDYDLQPLIMDKAVAYDLYAYVNVVGKFVWLSRNYIGPLGRIYPRGLSHVPERRHFKGFAGSLNLGPPEWFTLDSYINVYMFVVFYAKVSSHAPLLRLKARRRRKHTGLKKTSQDCERIGPYFCEGRVNQLTGAHRCTQSGRAFRFSVSCVPRRERAGAGWEGTGGVTWKKQGRLAIWIFTGLKWQVASRRESSSHFDVKP